MRGIKIQKLEDLKNRISVDVLYQLVYLNLELKLFFLSEKDYVIRYCVILDIKCI